ncbi:unnamed protein product [Orchesella dallaii]|uniref:C2H2-type domain-containing protein n=1 Tax=Orchesella dallaii TaxID=48710 RepID=A0ABP1QQY9_9HEXA
MELETDELNAENACNKETPTPALPTLKLREDLQPFFEVFSHPDSAVLCKLSKGGRRCKFDGPNATLKYDKERGWFPFERHLVRVHKFSYENLIKGISNEEFDNDSNEEACDASKAGPKSKRKRPRRDLQVNKSKCCVVCREVCTESKPYATNMSKLSGYGETRVFPGSEGCAQLNQQLFCFYFLRNIIDFPATKCEKYLKQYRGARMPETWFFMCSGCRTVVIKAVELDEQIVVLQRRLKKTHDLVKEKISGSVNTNCDAVLSDVATEVRKYILEPVPVVPTAAKKIKQAIREPLEDLVIENDNEDDWNEPFLDNTDDLDWNPSTENSIPIVTRTRSRRIRPSRSNKRKTAPPVVYDDDEAMDDIDETFANDNDMDESTPRLRIRRNIFLNEHNESDLQIDSIQSCVKIDPESEFAVQPTTEGLSGDDFGDGAETSALQMDVVDTGYPISPEAEAISEAEDDDCDYAAEEDQPDSEDLSDNDSDFAPSRKKKSSNKKQLESINTSDNSNSAQPKPAKPSSSPKKSTKTTIDAVGDQEYVCEICQSKYKNRKRFKDHKVAHEISKALGSRFECPQCGFPCTSEKAKNIHISYRHKKNVFQCSLCCFSAPRKRQLTNHIKEHKKECQNERVGDKYLCSICNRLFISYRHLCKHKRLAHFKEIGIEPPTCQYCNDTFSSSQHLKDHVQQTHNKDSRYYCEICGRGTLYLSKLKRHMKSHQKERLHVCNICGADFLYDETMRSHIRKEHPESTLGKRPGDTSAGAESNQSSSVIKVKHTCKHCGLDLPSGSCLNRHIKTHKELFSNECDLCGKGYATPQSLRRHKEINHTSIQVPCPYCDKMFPHKEYIRMHYKFCKLYPGRKEPLGETAVEDSETNVTSDNMKVEKETAQISSNETTHNIGNGNDTQVVIPSQMTEISPSIEIHATQSFEVQQTQEVYTVTNAPVIIPAQFRLVVSTEEYQQMTQ